MYYRIDQQVNFPSLCEEIADYWERNHIFEKSLHGPEEQPPGRCGHVSTDSDKQTDAIAGQRPPRKSDEITFYDGPPFPTGTPHHGTLFVSILKDSLARFFTMQGYRVPRKWGWDCHGLPIENKVEQLLGITKSEIGQSVSIKKFNAECRDYVSNCNDAWETYISKIGRWVDYKSSYKTLDTTYMESVLWVFKTCYDKGLIYKDYRVTPYCWQCGTSLSLSDTRESDSMRPRQDPELTVKFRAAETFDGRDMYFLAWTTTPWTLPSNLFLAVGESYTYVVVEHEEELLVMAESRLEKYAQELGENPHIRHRFKGSDLVGKCYRPLFPYFAESAKQGYFQILPADFVTLDDGVGIVHVAPAFGEDDYWLAKQHGYGVRNPVDAEGCFTDAVTEFAGRNVLEANADIIRLLKSHGVVLRHRTLTHNYPHCWRCREPLIYRADDAWYFAVEKIKGALLEQNQQINWVPEDLQQGRFGKWLEGARDWNLSRTRFWGTPLPVWECSHPDCTHVTVLGSIAEIQDRTCDTTAGPPSAPKCDNGASGRLSMDSNRQAETAPRQGPSRRCNEVTDLHKEVLDGVVFPCEKCGATMQRVPEVLDCWFESASMPYGQCHYPFENKEWFEEHFPADFIVEYPGQLRGWFYYLHVLSVALFERPAFRNCLVHGTLLAEDGTKLSKSKNNFTDPMQLIDKFGADAVRLYLLNSPAAVMQDLRFRDEGISEATRKVLLPLWNAYSFFATYANIDDYRGDLDAIPKAESELDRWILASLYAMAKKVTKAYETYHLNRCLPPVLAFLDDLTNWYIRRSRKRFWSHGMSRDKQHAYDTLYYILVSVTKILAPSAPFMAEKLFRHLTGLESVHLASWPNVPDAYADKALVESTALVRKVAGLGLALRQQKKIKVRQPLQQLFVALPDACVELGESCLGLLKSELNVKEIVIFDNPEDIAVLRAVPDARKLGPVYGREMQAIICAAREGKLQRNTEKGTVSVFGHSKTWELDESEIDIGYQGKQGVDVLSDGGILVGLNPEITPALHEEGVVNELNRCIQDLRKEAGYTVSDRILLDIHGALSDQQLQQLADSAFADLAPLDANCADAHTRITVDERSFFVAVCKVWVGP